MCASGALPAQAWVLYVIHVIHAFHACHRGAYVTAGGGITARAGATSFYGR